jgi:hypothetical protein
LRWIGQDYFSHRIFPVREDLDLKECNKLVNDIITEAIARYESEIKKKNQKA